jgi:hypothetical protein
MRVSVDRHAERHHRVGSGAMTVSGRHRIGRNDMVGPQRVAVDSSTEPIYHRRPMVAVHDRNGWRAVDQP